MKEISIWHNPRCSKSREALKIAQESEYETTIVKYLDTKPTKDEIKKILSMLGLSARELMRTKEAIYKELNLKEEQDEDKLVDAMSKYQKLIERPIVIKGNKAIIGRPSSIIFEFLNS